jgi:hemolysin activation/secretion protein
MKIRSKILPLALLALSHSAFAQQPPGAGSQLNQLPPPADLPRAPPKVLIEESTAAPETGTEGARVLVNELRFTGASAFPEAELLAATGFVPGTEVTLAQLQAMAARVTAYYRERGYFVANAILPAQDISTRVVTIAVSEGRFGEVILRNNSTLSDGLVHQVLGDPGTGEPILIEPLESRLLRLSDIPGVNIRSTLAPGTAPGSSDLIIDVEPGRRITGFVDADNAGNPYTGENRVGGQLNFNNLMGRGDVASLRLLTSGEGLQYGRASYQTMLGRVTAGVAYSWLEYELGKQFKPLGANGTAKVASVYGSLPLIRSRDTNLYTGLTFERKRFEDRLDLFPAADRLASADVLSLSLYGDHRDALWGGGENRFYLNLSGGRLDIESALPRAIDAATARTQGDYSKLWWYASRVQRVTETLSLSAALTGQLASKNLDPSEKLVLGGMDGVRAYPQGEGTGDEGVIAAVEARLLLARTSDRIPGQLHLLGFVDAGRITINKDPWFPGDNERTLSGAGVGLIWSEPGNWSVRTYYAWKLGSEQALSAPDKSGRFWIQAVKYF